MSWIESFTFVMKSSLTTLREKIEDPERMLHQLLCDMEEEQECVRTSVAAAIADEIQLAKEIAAVRGEAETWSDRAAAAMQRGDEAGARAALDQRMRCEERLETLESGYEKQRDSVEALQRSYRELEDKIREARHKRTLLVARLSRAKSSDRVNRALDRAAGDSAFAEFSRLERKVERAEALSEAHDRLAGRDPKAEALAAKFAADERRERLEREMEDLRRRTAGAT